MVEQRKRPILTREERRDLLVLQLRTSSEFARYTDRVGIASTEHLEAEIDTSAKALAKLHRKAAERGYSPADFDKEVLSLHVAAERVIEKKGIEIKNDISGKIDEILDGIGELKIPSRVSEILTNEELKDLLIVFLRAKAADLDLDNIAKFVGMAAAALIIDARKRDDTETMERVSADALSLNWKLLSDILLSTTGERIRSIAQARGLRETEVGEEFERIISRLPAASYMVSAGNIALRGVSAATEAEGIIYTLLIMDSQ